MPIRTSRSGQPYAYLFTAAQERSICAEYRKGATLGGLAKKYGTNKQTIQNIRRRRGVPHHVTVKDGKREPFTPAHKKRIVAAYKRGAFFVDLVREYGSTNAMMRRVLTDAGVTMRTQSETMQKAVERRVVPYRFEGQHLERLKEDYATHTMWDLSRKHGSTFTTVKNALIRAGVETRPRAYYWEVCTFKNIVKRDSMIQRLQAKLRSAA